METATKPVETAAGARREPNFFLVGASRAGTTSLWQYLKQHPDVFMTGGRLMTKEPSHFCELTPSWAHTYRDVDSYLALFEGAADARAVGEASTTYLPSPEVPARIYERYPDARIVILLRNPADRAYSLYSLMCQIGCEWIAPFERALAEEELRYASAEFRRDNPFWFFAYLYFRSGLYSEQVERYLTVFPADQVKVILFEDLRRHPIETTQDTYEFLGVDRDFRPSVKVHNQSVIPLSLSLQNALARRWSVHPTNGAATEQTGLDRLWRAALMANLVFGLLRRRKYRQSTRRFLLRRYEADILKTGALIGRDLDAWVYGEQVPEA